MSRVFLHAACALIASGTWLSHAPAARAQDANRDAVATVSEARDIVDSLAKRTGEFQAEFAKAVEHSMMADSKLEDRAKKRSADLSESARKLKDIFRDKPDKNDPAVREQVDKTMAAGGDIARVMLANRFTDQLQREWGLLRGELNLPAQIYSLSPI